MEAVLAKSAGFCFGVERAVEAVYRVLSEEEKKEAKDRRPIYTYGAIVHNEQVVKALEDRGVKLLKTKEELAHLEKGILVIRAHGVGEGISKLWTAPVPMYVRFSDLCGSTVKREKESL